MSDRVKAVLQSFPMLQAPDFEKSSSWLLTQVIWELVLYCKKIVKVLTIQSATTPRSLMNIKKGILQ